ncbi:GDSL-type esterase/lipase family protein [Faecalibaculum rodentium]|uniref:GDSL-type esterase/lipase family protein n=1 Tax=Faecalibaculum rodentium TaxID=1702221 RepID=UPI001F57F3D9|nr:GDSL-type esterase/lipase family protein [Faecalibaculum rodentium]
MTKRILCFGDSNTWGFSPADGQRMDHRWTRLLNTAGTLDAEILEEGLNSRNAVCRDHHMPEKCGYDAWKMMMLSHKPLDAVVLMLGTNDLKSTYHCSARYIANGLREYVREWMNPTLYEGTKQPRLLVVSPILLGDNLADLEGEGGGFNRYSMEQSRLLWEELQAALAPYPVTLLNAADFAEASSLDGLHMDKENHARLAAAIGSTLQEMLADSPENPDHDA